MKDSTKTKITVTVGSVLAAGVGALLAGAFAKKPATGVTNGARLKGKAGCGGCGR